MVAPERRQAHGVPEAARSLAGGKGLEDSAGWGLRGDGVVWRCRGVGGERFREEASTRAPALVCRGGEPDGAVSPGNDLVREEQTDAAAFVEVREDSLQGDH